MNKMTEEEMRYFIFAMALGTACGLTHRYECFVNINRSLVHFEKYEDIPKKSEEYANAFLKFERMLSTSEDESAVLDSMTINDYYDLVNQYYKK